MSWWESELVSDEDRDPEMTVPGPRHGTNVLSVGTPSSPLLSASSPTTTTSGVTKGTGLPPGALPWQISADDTARMKPVAPVETVGAMSMPSTRMSVAQAPVTPVPSAPTPVIQMPMPYVPVVEPPIVEPPVTGVGVVGPGMDAVVDGFEYATFWRRLVAMTIDGLVGVLLFMPLVALAGLGIGIAAGLSSDALAALVFLMVLVDLGFGPMAYAIVGASRGQTLGKRMVGIRVCRMDGQRLGFWLAIGRNCLNVLSTLPLMIGWLAPLWSPKKQTWHDSMTGTVVIRDTEARLAGRAVVWGIAWSLIGSLLVGLPTAWLVKLADDDGAFDSYGGDSSYSYDYDYGSDECYTDDYYCDLSD